MESCRRVATALAGSEEALPRVFDNIDLPLLPELRQMLGLSKRADFCVGYFNLRGWRALDDFIDVWPGGDGNQCRLLVGMQRLPEEDVLSLFGATAQEPELDNQRAAQLRKSLADEFRRQLTIGVPTNADETGLHRLARQLRDRKVVVKLFLRHPLHAKLYLCFRPDPINPAVGYVGSSNLTMAGLARQGELNVDVMDHDATKKLADWFEERWSDKWCIDISDELIEILAQSWARDTPLAPYRVYVKMAYHLSQDARAGLSEFRIPAEFGDKLFDYQVAAVKIAAHHLNKRGGVLIGDVVGLGKTLMASALARIFQDDHGTDALIISPKNLVKMWSDYVSEYRLLARVMSSSTAIRDLPELRRYRLVVIDESQNLRNREGKTYRAIQEYIQRNGSMCVLLSATPYNKTYLDLSSQLRLFIPEDLDIGIRPERLLREIGETEFIRRHQAPVRSLAAFDKSEYPDDWRELMRLYMVRRTRTFIKDNYAEVDSDSGRHYLVLEDGSRAYFPDRIPRTVTFEVDEGDPEDQYARLYADDVVDAINTLKLPRYGLGNYIEDHPSEPPTPKESKVLDDLSRAGKRLMGFCRTNLFKRLESSGAVFEQSIRSHILRNYVYLYALDNQLPFPVGTQDAAMLDTGVNDEDVETLLDAQSEEPDEDGVEPEDVRLLRGFSDAASAAEAEAIYELYSTRYKRRFKWVRPGLFSSELADDLRFDIEALAGILTNSGPWDASNDSKLAALERLLVEVHPDEKVLVFTQFADTVTYLEREIQARGVEGVAGVSGSAQDPTSFAWRFSPESNEKSEWAASRGHIRVLIATDVLSEGQNLQDAHIVVNFDLPWAIIRLIQRAGRVDRIGQKSEEILCYSFLPADGVERLIRLRARVSTRLTENAEVVGTDEAFFEDELATGHLLDLYHEKAGILDGDTDSEVDLVSFAYQIWKNACEEDPSLAHEIPALPDVVYSTKANETTATTPNGVLAYIRTSQRNDALVWMDERGEVVTESQLLILRAADCRPEDPPVTRLDSHHALVSAAVEHVSREEQLSGGQLGRPSGARFRTYERLKRYAEVVTGTLFDSPALAKAVEEIYKYPLQSGARDTLNRQLRAGIEDQALADLVTGLRDDGRLCLVQEDLTNSAEPQIVCSLGIASEAV